MSKQVGNAETLQKTIETRRNELTDALKEKVNQLFSLSVDKEDLKEKDSYEFATTMVLSECFRAIGYWDNQLHQTVQTIQKTKNEKVQ